MKNFENEKDCQTTDNQKDIYIHDEDILGIMRNGEQEMPITFHNLGAAK